MRPVAFRRPMLLRPAIAAEAEVLAELRAALLAKHPDATRIREDGWRWHPAEAGGYVLLTALAPDDATETP